MLGGRRGRRKTVLRAAARLCGLAAILLAATWLPAAAQTTHPTVRPERNAPILFRADELVEDRELNLITARGHVEIAQGDRVIRADVVSYNRQSGVITASGNVTLVEPTGEVVFADYMELTKNLDEAVIQNLKVIMADQGRFAAVSGRRSENGVTIGRRATYSPCELCKDDPTRPPVWQIKAARITHDQQDHQVTYNDAWMEMFGVPVAYTPYLSHPDGTVQRQSGLLAPDFLSSGILGPSVITPYYYAISPTSDATFSPMWLANDNPVLAGEYRQQLQEGHFELNGSVTDAKRRDDNNNPTGGDEVRGHVKSFGNFDVDDDWRWGFNLERSTDRTYLQRYSMMERYKFYNSNELTTNVFSEGFRDRNYAAVNTYAFQSLRPGDPYGLAPYVLPALDGNWVTEPGAYGGHYFLDANAMSIYRTSGTVDQRVITRGGWTAPYTAPDGEIYQLSLITYGQTYYTDHMGTADDPFRPTQDGFQGRLVPQMDLQWRYPFVRRDTGLTTVVEPIVQLDAAPNLGDQTKFPNEDSRTFDFDDTDLFRANRFAGYDRLDGGQRVTYGFNTDFRRDLGGHVGLLIGQSYSLHEDNAFPTGSGLENQTSNYVARVIVQPHPWFSSAYYTQINRENFSANRDRATVTFGPHALSLSFDYLYINRLSQLGLNTNTEQLQVTPRIQLTENWRLQSQYLVSLANGDEGTLLWRDSVIYEDDCLLLGLDVTRRYVGRQDFPPDTSGVLRIVFRNLGEVRTAAF